MQILMVAVAVVECYYSMGPPTGNAYVRTRTRTLSKAETLLCP